MNVSRQICLLIEGRMACPNASYFLSLRAFPCVILSLDLAFQTLSFTECEERGLDVPCYCRQVMSQHMFPQELPPLDRYFI